MAVVYAVVVMLSGLGLSETALKADGYLGVQIRDDDGKIVVVEAFKDSPADKAGVKADDVITKIDGKDPGTLEEFIKTIRGKKPGDEVKLIVTRDGKEKEIKVKIGEKPDSPA
jgi:S1-C subfamily serine protease